MRLENRVAIITGAGRGIGRAIALAYAKEGARLALAARTISELEETAQQAEALSAEAWVIPTDVSDQARVEEMVRRTVERYSTIDILVNNAGIVGPIGPLWENDVSSWIQTIQVNLTGTYLCCRAVMPVMLWQNRGKIINVTSGARAPGGYYRAARHLAAYMSSKAAITRLTEVLSHQLAGKNIQVNAMSPGGNTRAFEELLDHAKQIGDIELFELAQRGSTADARERSAELAVFLASDASGDLNGRVIHVSDDFNNLPPRIPEIMTSDAYTLRRVELG